MDEKNNNQNDFKKWLETQPAEYQKLWEDLKNKENMYRVLVETSPDCVKLFDTKGNLLFMNKGGLTEHRLTNLEEALDKKWSTIETVIEEDKEKFKEAFKNASGGKVITVELNHTPEGSISTACLETVAPIIDKNGKVINIFGVSRDISEIKKLKDELQNRVDDLERLNKIMTGRELQMINLKKEVNSLLKKLNKPKKY